MQQVFVISKASFVSSAVGSVNRKQRLLVSQQLAHELVTMGLVDYEDKAQEVSELKKSSPSLPVQEDGKDQPSASLPAATVPQKLTLSNAKKDKNKKAGK
jgi:hypothetical protein